MMNSKVGVQHVAWGLVYMSGFQPSIWMAC